MRATIGHVHLKVADLERAIAFYRDVLGFELTQRYGKDAAFLSSDGYHHHIGLNTWRGEGLPAPPPGSLGLRDFELTLPSADALAATIARLRAGGAAIDAAKDGEALCRDPAGNAVRLVVAAV